jgi:hypothetical protein
VTSSPLSPRGDAMRKSPSMLVAGVPHTRGAPEHFEHTDETAVTIFSDKGKVLEIHTPQEVTRRVHELMHAKHTNRARYLRQYRGVVHDVREITEDCRLHLGHWPWHQGHTPQQVATAVTSFMDDELERCEECKQKIEDKTLDGDQLQKAIWAHFAVRLRRKAVLEGMNGPVEYDLNFTTAEEQLVQQVFSLLGDGCEGKAAELLQSVFFPPPPEVPGNDPETPNRKRGRGRGGTPARPKMEIIELKHTDPIAEAVVGSRIATSGPRLYRPALRKLVIPNRCFVRRSPQEPGGTILIDASGSMGSWDQVKDWCQKAPFGTVAYYAGRDSKGWLYVYARNGYRAREIVKPRGGGNVVDGPALDWLMSQEGPRIMVTDRQFCGASESLAQKVRLEHLEARGEVTVVDYSSEE